MKLKKVIIPVLIATIITSNFLFVFAEDNIENNNTIEVTEDNPIINNDLEDEQNILQNEIIENNIDVNLIVSNFSDGNWNVCIKPSDIDSDWKDSDSISLLDFSNYNKKSYIDNVYLLELNNQDYQVGTTMALKFLNNNTDCEKAIYINFSNTNIPTFHSVDEASCFIKSENLEYSILPQSKNSRSLASDIILPTKDDSEFPDDIILAEPTNSELLMKNKKATTSTTKYNIYNNSGQLVLSNQLSPFYAIQYINQYGANGWYVKQSNDNTIIFTLNKNSTSTFYKFQFTNFYGTTDVTGAKSWTLGYAYSHVVRCDGIFGADTSNTQDQPYAHAYKSLLRVPELWALEGNTGAYVYKKSLSTNGYRSIDGYVNLRNAQLKFDSTGKTPFNAFIYMSSNSNSVNGSIGCDLGLISAPSHNGDWYLVTSRTQSSATSTTNGVKILYSTPLVRSNYSNGIYTPTSDIYLRYSYNQGSVSIYAMNTTTGVIQTATINDTKFDQKSPNITLMTGTSLVPDKSRFGNGVSNIKSDAYLKNVVWTNGKIYSGINGTGTASSFAGGTSSTTNYVLIYDTDNVTYDTSGTNETVNINYSSLYK